MYGKAPKMSTPKAPAKKGGTPVTIMVAVGKPKLPVRGQRTMTNKMTRGKK
jgi:hypothetical protein